MENKYFTPAIEDFHIGYECELLMNTNVSILNPTSNAPEFKPFIFEKNKIELLIELYDSIRVPYLTKEQIEAEGWFLHGQGNDNGIVHSLFKNSFRVAIWKDSLKIEVQESEGNILFHGECKDINTFRTICKLLKIN